MNEVESILFSILLFSGFSTAILFVLFGQITVRKLRKIPETKNHLGFEFASGWDILNVAQAFSVPKWFREKVKGSPLSFLRADFNLLYNHTTKFDRILARIFFLFYFFTGMLTIVLVILDQFGFFE